MVDTPTSIVILEENDYDIDYIEEKDELQKSLYNNKVYLSSLLFSFFLNSSTPSEVNGFVKSEY
jgi:hypothetical protein